MGDGEGTRSGDGLTRRTVLGRAAVAGGAMAWAVPVVEVVGAPLASAQAAGSPPPGDTGRISGLVVDATTGAPVAGALVTVAGTGLSATTGPTGSYSIGGVPAGSRTVSASASGYVPATASVTVPAGGSVTRDLSLSPAGLVTAVLNWGAVPADLDLHASGPDGSGGRFHAYYRDRNPVPHASLDIDDTSSFGPETVTISVTAGPGGTYVPGDYHVWVHDYTNRSGSAQFAQSGASVRLNDLTSQRAEYLVSGASGTSTLPIWLVVHFTLDAAGNMSPITPQQSFAAGTETTVF